MGNAVEEIYVNTWVCGECGNKTFRVYQHNDKDMELVCDTCDTPVEDIKIVPDKKSRD